MNRRAFIAGLGGAAGGGAGAVMRLGARWKGLVQLQSCCE
jgi:hypothetical protein